MLMGPKELNPKITVHNVNVAKKKVCTKLHNDIVKTFSHYTTSNEVATNSYI